jgi:hypothetical protein
MKALPDQITPITNEVLRKKMNVHEVSLQTSRRAAIGLLAVSMACLALPAKGASRGLRIDNHKAPRSVQAAQPAITPALTFSFGMIDYPRQAGSIANAINNFR